MPVQVVRLNSSGGAWPWRLPQTQEGYQYYMTNAPFAGANTASVLTLVEVNRMFKAMEKKITSLEKQIAKLKAQKAGR